MSASDLEAVRLVLARAACPEDVFGALAGDDASQLAALKRGYFRVVGAVHPDHFQGTPEIALAERLVHELTQWRERGEAKVRAGTYGDGKPHVAAPSVPKAAPQVIEVKGRRYVVTDRLAQGDLADVYRCTYMQEGTERSAVFKIAQSPADNDLIENEGRILSKMYPAAQSPEKFYRYLPKPLSTFLLKGDRGAPRRVNILELAEGHVSLADVLAVYPRGLDYRDVAWMFKRALAALYFVHQERLVIHGAVLPPHILVHPTGHGAKLVDWSYAVSSGHDRIKAICKDYHGWYAPEILNKETPGPETDLFMLGRTAAALLGGDGATGAMPDAVPREVRRFVQSMMLGRRSARPTDAGELHEQFDALLKKLVGKPTYRPLAMPARP